ncbi:MAG: hypothetical protein ACK5PD_12955 [Pirellulaceae bacterium]
MVKISSAAPMRWFSLAVSALLLYSTMTRIGTGGECSAYRMAAFSCDVTPPIGHSLSASLGVSAVTSIADPLMAYGWILYGEGEPVVLVSVDWCGIGNEAHDGWRTQIAEAARTTRDRVLVCTIHQHDAPLVDWSAEQLLAGVDQPGKVVDLSWHESVLERVSEVVGSAADRSVEISHVGVGESEVERIASNRRIFGTDGRVVRFRGSASQDPALQEAPEGLVDPKLKLISFWNQEQPIASLAVYATHPMSFYGKGEVSSDFVGLARRWMENEVSRGVHFYANGCGGNLAAGKYNDGSQASRIELAERLHRAWVSAWKSTRKTPLEIARFHSANMNLLPREEIGFRQSDFERLLRNEDAALSERVRAAFGLSWLNRCTDLQHGLDLPMIDFGVAKLLLLPGEPFVEYQLFAQQAAPDSMVFTLGYGDYGPCYIPYDKAYEEVGYEPGAWSFVGPGVERRVQAAIDDVLSDERKPLR